MRSARFPLALLLVLLASCESITGGDDAGDSPDVGLKPATDVSAGRFHTCRLESNGVASCWGRNSDGQLGDGTTGDSPSPVAVSGGIRFESIVAGAWHTCGLDANGKAFCWGDNSVGAVGDGTTTDRAVPTPVAGGHRFVQISAGYVSTCAVEQGGAAFCWGNNSGGRLGDGGATDSNTPIPVAGGHHFSEVSVGTIHSCALENGNAFCWGLSNNGVLGRLGDSTVPVPVVGSPGGTGDPAPKLTHLDAGSSNTCGLDAAGQAWCWGNRVGMGSLRADTHYAAKVAVGRKFVSIDAGQGSQICGIEAGGATSCWGSNQTGQIGNGTSSSTYVEQPAAVSGGLHFSSVSGGYNHSCGVVSEGTTYCWGSNDNGQMGDGTVNASSIPVRVGAPGNHVPTSPTISVTTFTENAVTVNGGAFSDRDGGDTHTASEWQLDAKDGDWRAGPFRSSGITNGNLTTYTFSGLRPAATYRVRVRYRDHNGSFSAFSTAAEFTTKAVPGATDPAGSWDLVSWGGDPVPALAGSQFYLRSELVLKANGVWIRTNDVLDISALVRFRPLASGSTSGTYAFVKDTVVLNPGSASFAVPYRNDTLVFGGTYALRKSGSAATLDSRLRAAVAKIPQNVMNSLAYNLWAWYGGNSGTDYCGTRQDQGADLLRASGYPVAREGSSWRVTRANGEMIVGDDFCRTGTLAILLDKLAAL